ERLQELAAELDAVGSASAHPSDLLQNAAFVEARALLAGDEITLRTVIDYASGAHWMLSAAAFAALAERADREAPGAALAARLGDIGPWPMYYALKYFASLETRPALGALVTSGKEWWADQPIVHTLLAEHFAERRERGDPIDFGDALAGLSSGEAQQVEMLLQRIDDPAAAELLEQLRAWRATSLDRAFLESFGRFHEPDFTERLLVEHDAIAEQLAIAQACVTHQPARSVLAVAEPRAGKTSFLRLLALKMREQGWVLFEAGSASLMSGQKYFGQLEERLRRLTSELAVEKRVLWYAPDLMQLAASGRHEGQHASMLDQMLPAIAAGRIVMLSETTPAGLTKLLKEKPGVRSVFEILRLRALADDEVTALSEQVARRMADELGVHIGPEALDAANHLARYYLGTAQMPGALLDLMKLGAQHAAAADRSELVRDDLLLVLSQMTGMPRSVLDDRERIELAQIREFFAARVIGQPEAVAAVVDRIAMLKAGLTDPARPTAVFL